MCATLGKLLHSKLPQSTQLYKWVPGKSWGAKVTIQSAGFGIIGSRWDSQVRRLPDMGLMPTPDGAPIGCSSQSSGPAWVEVWMPDAQARVAKWHSLAWCTSAGGS